MNRNKKILMKGNEAIAEAAMRAGMKAYFCYPITPQSEIPEYLAKHFPKKGGIFLQAESEIAAINMVYGAAAAGKRTMTSSSGPGISLKQETISYIALAEVPCVIVDIMRGGPGLGGIQPSQADYFQMTKGGGHGDYRQIVLAPSTVQEAADLTMLAFDLADKYRITAVLLADGALGQMKEAVEFKECAPFIVPKPWALTGAKNRKPNKIVPFNLDPYELEKMNLALQKKYRVIEHNEIRYESVTLKNKSERPDIILVAYGITGRIAKTAIKMAEKDGIKTGLIRPITLWPFPYPLIEICAKIIPDAKFLAVEMSAGQMVEDVRLAVQNNERVYFYGRTGGVVPTPEEIFEEIKKIKEGR